MALIFRLDNTYFAIPMTKYVEQGRIPVGKSLNPRKAAPRGYKWKVEIEHLRLPVYRGVGPA
jgi:hypothetical protein